MSSPVSGTPLSSAERPTAVFISSARTCWYLLAQALMQWYRCDDPVTVALQLRTGNLSHPISIGNWYVTRAYLQRSYHGGLCKPGAFLPKCTVH